MELEQVIDRVTSKLGGVSLSGSVLDLPAETCTSSGNSVTAATEKSLSRKTLTGK
jgi:hypothetical protein